VTALDLAVLLLTTWRVSAMLSYEAGPWDLFLRLRATLGIEHDADGAVTGFPMRLLPRLFSCVWCLSIWVGAIFAVSYWLAPDICRWLALPFALSAGAIIVERVAHE